MKLVTKLTITALAVLSLSACQTRQADQTQTAKVSNRASNASVARSAYNFDSEDIKVPAYFDTQGLQNCTFNPATESDACPLKKPTVRMYFAGTDVGGEGQGVEALREYDDKQLLFMLENQFAGINRFRIITRDDDVISQEKQIFMEQQGARALAERAGSQKVLKPDFIVKLDTLRTVKSEGSITGWMDYTLELTTAVLNPFTRELMSYPNLGKIRVKSEDVRERNELKYVMVNNRYETGFRYHDPAHVNAVINDMTSRGIDILLTRMLSEMPATAQVLGIKGNQVSLDRGQNAGVLPNETMIIFQYEAGFVEPIGVANVNPSRNSAVGEIAVWKNSDLAEQVERSAANGIYRPSNGTKIFAVSVGTPAGFLESRT
ncbi:hypothetical protein [Idiomarina piscisalsi]|jgi:hypothetical protein|uniref:Uncharacterized protein n=1 Tax=Idiomarina piscisalsi TaxID=1096243 RepID=A0A432YTM4_9GAMM|nr:hypothetical protein [Idiomarina piscisalsi]RUO66667.1 hypothetical protein CWI73_05125 [Idiomarina piscisalsi]|tara:strand:+ start:2622 stop:3749 length:1128 start_codon:yes stop_codon:yes gene_type:complete